MTSTIPISAAPALLNRHLSEKAFQARVVALAKLNHWLLYHTHDSRHSVAGFPDLVMVRLGRVVFAELKSQCGEPTEEQERWLQTLRMTGKCEAYLWRPSDYPEIQETLA